MRYPLSHHFSLNKPCIKRSSEWCGILVLASRYIAGDSYDGNNGAYKRIAELLKEAVEN